jgi:hypothetical protein
MPLEDYIERLSLKVSTKDRIAMAQRILDTATIKARA